ncbi:MAG: hypothetical protein IAG10_25755 [Planctomycetaceae bacterium]|nr:hypothetical protein [Planctomycetaceae bacterium]
MLRIFAFVVGLSLCGMNLLAQDFSVNTRVFDLDSEEANQPVARSLTLFHAGKVYDVIHGAAEATILEPAHRRIVILNSDRGVVSSVDFDELKHLLLSAEERWGQRIRELEEQSKPPRQQIEAERFQLRPKFETQFDPREHRLRLLSKTVSYEVVGPANVRPEAVEAYLNFADWMCRLNFVLHPQALFPNVRLELNERLKQQKLLPVEVTLRAKLERPLNLKAEHSVTWTLDARGRQIIDKCESLLRDPKLKKVSLSEYQRISVTQQTAKLSKADGKK